MIEVVVAGPLTSIQTAFGRPGWRSLGVPVGGAADPWNARLANRLAGNVDDAALLEVTLGGAVLRVHAPTAVGHAGGTTLRIDGLEPPPSSATFVRAGATMRIDGGGGARGYVAFAGGIDAELILGSPATDLRSGFGGLQGRALRDGDRLTVGPSRGTPARWRGAGIRGPIRIIVGPHGDGGELQGQWTVGTEADRAGVRLDGRLLPGGEVASMGLPVGAIQVPPDGRPIVMLADRPVTGGYLVPACVARADIGRVAQLRPGDLVTFVSVSVEEALEGLRQAEAELNAVEPMTPPRDEELGWAGSHA